MYKCIFSQADVNDKNSITVNLFFTTIKVCLNIVSNDPIKEGDICIGKKGIVDIKKEYKY